MVDLLEFHRTLRVRRKIDERHRVVATGRTKTGDAVEKDVCGVRDRAFKGREAMNLLDRRAVDKFADLSGVWRRTSSSVRDLSISGKRR